MSRGKVSSWATRSGSARTRVAFFGSTGVADQRPHRDERERHAVHLGVLGREHVVLVGHVGGAAQRPPHDLLAEELRREGADAEHVRHRVGVPALGEHRDADDALDLLAQAPGLADRVHDLAQQVLVGDRLGVALGEALAVLGLELLDLAGHVFLELGAELLARLELRGVDEDGVGPVGPLAVLHVAEELEVAGGDHAQGIVTLAAQLLPARDPVEDQLRDAGVVAHHDEHRRGEAGCLGRPPRRRDSRPRSTSRSCRRG